jgi:ubiquinone/menaquinone biosynthesis C-methylase UbiE
VRETQPALRFRETLAALAAPHGAIALARHAPRTGARVLVVDCGSGETSLDLARLVGPKGTVIGLERCEELLAIAIGDARSLHMANVSFVRAEAASHLFDGTADLVFARFAPTFFDAPRAALAKLRNALGARGRLLLVTWGELAANPWVHVPWLEVARLLGPMPDGPGGSVCAWGPFAMSEPAAVRAMLEDAGYTDVAFEHVRASIIAGRSLDEAVALHLERGFIGDMVRRASATGEHVDHGAVVARLRAALAPYVTARGVLMDSCSLCVTASRAS